VSTFLRTSHVYQYNRYILVVCLYGCAVSWGFWWHQAFSQCVLIVQSCHLLSYTTDLSFLDASWKGISVAEQLRL
jgi:hypothetical protein